jgi:hypothetical protein
MWNIQAKSDSGIAMDRRKNPLSDLDFYVGGAES